jgi:hypothetical protein
MLKAVLDELATSPSMLEKWANAVFSKKIIKRAVDQDWVLNPSSLVQEL